MHETEEYVKMSYRIIERALKTEELIVQTFAIDASRGYHEVTVTTVISFDKMENEMKKE